MVIIMVYVDLVFIINFLYDFLILDTLNVVLKRNVKRKRILIGAFVGSLTTFSLYLKILSNPIVVLLCSLIVLLVTFGYKDIIYYKNNILYFYMISVIYGGFLYVVNININKYINITDPYNKRVLINFLGLLISSPIVYLLEIYSYRNNQIKHHNYYPLKFSLNNYIHNVTAFYDSGNLIKDPYKGRPIIIIEESILDGDIKNKSPVYVPISMLSTNTLIECYKPDLLVINDKVINNCLIGLWKDKLMYDDVKAIISGFIGDKIK